MHRLDTFPTNTLIDQYRRVFSTPNGIDVLVHMLYEFGIFSEISDSKEDVVLKNQGIRLLKILGAGEPDEDTLKVFVRKLMRQQLLKETPDE